MERSILRCEGKVRDVLKARRTELFPVCGKTFRLRKHRIHQCVSRIQANDTPLTLFSVAEGQLKHMYPYHSVDAKFWGEK